MTVPSPAARPATQLWLIGLAFASFHLAHGDDWPQWMGPRRDGIWLEAGITATIPAEGLPVKWRVPVGGGY